MEPASVESPLIACNVVRGVCRLFHHLGYVTLAEVPLRNGRRADIVAIDPKGEVSICEIKVSLADLRGDAKWPDYSDFCDRFYWSVPGGMLQTVLAEERYRPEVSGLIVADRYDAAIVRPASLVPLSAARRRTEILRFARLAASRLLRRSDPFCGELC